MSSARYRFTSLCTPMNLLQIGSHEIKEELLDGIETVFKDVSRDQGVS